MGLISRVSSRTYRDMQLIPCKICGKQSDSIEEYVQCLIECEKPETNTRNETANFELLKHTNDKKWYETHNSTQHSTHISTQNLSSARFTNSSTYDSTKSSYKSYDYRTASQNLYEKVVAASMNTSQQIIKSSSTSKNNALPCLVDANKNPSPENSKT